MVQRGDRQTLDSEYEANKCRDHLIYGNVDQDMGLELGPKKRIYLFVQRRYTVDSQHRWWFKKTTNTLGQGFQNL